MTADFARLGVPTMLASVLERQGIVEPFPVQTATIPDAMDGRDICGRAPTGSGKTLAFGLPLMARVGKADSRRPRALVLAPTRELAEQIRRELIPLASAVGRKVVAVYGGASYHPQREKLRRGADVLVACPGRLADLIERGDVRLDRVDIVVIDEADRMGDMGFLPQVRALLDMTATTRQTLLFSATLDGDVAVLTRDYQDDPVRHEVGPAATDTGDSRHFFWRAEGPERIDHTGDIVRTAGQTIVFTRTRHGADRLARQLTARGVTAAAIHGGRSQGQRRRALEMFTDRRVQALVATDVAARGIHVDAVACVVHYDPPADTKDYLHRSGRTARAGASGSVVSLIGGAQVRAARRMQRDLGLSHDIVPPGTGGLSSGGERIDPAGLALTGSGPTGNGSTAGNGRGTRRHRGGDTREGNGGQRGGARTRSAAGGRNRRRRHRSDHRGGGRGGRPRGAGAVGR